MDPSRAEIPGFERVILENFLERRLCLRVFSLHFYTAPLAHLLPFKRNHYLHLKA